jgi:hypothetical protein
MQSHQNMPCARLIKQAAGDLSQMAQGGTLRGGAYSRLACNDPSIASIIYALVTTQITRTPSSAISCPASFGLGRRRRRHERSYSILPDYVKYRLKKKKAGYSNRCKLGGNAQEAGKEHRRQENSYFVFCTIEKHIYFDSAYQHSKLTSSPPMWTYLSGKTVVISLKNLCRKSKVDFFVGSIGPCSPFGTPFL